jgi:sulfur-carrier protein
MIDVHYFASIRESLGCGHEQVVAGENTATVGGLMEALVTLHGAKWHKVLREGRVLMAVNQAVARPDTAVRDGDEVAFFPPVTGG